MEELQDPSSWDSGGWRIKVINTTGLSQTKKASLSLQGKTCWWLLGTIHDHSLGNEQTLSGLP